MKGNSPIVCVRFQPLMLAAFDEGIRIANSKGATPPYTRSSFLQLAASSFLDQLQREQEQAQPRKVPARKTALARGRDKANAKRARARGK